MRVRSGALALLGGLAMAGGDPVIELTSHERARAASLDLRGVVLDTDELDALEAAGGLTDEMIEAWLASDGFVDQAVRHHQAIFWNELAISLLFNRRLRTSDDIWYRQAASLYSRGERNLGCSDYEADVDAEGMPQSWIETEDGFIDEGWVWVEPYWEPGTEIKVCAYDALTAESTSLGVDCTTGDDAWREVECGCGPNLEWCLPNSIRSAIEDAMVADLDQRVRSVMESGAAYETLLSGTVGYVNGPLAHFYRHLAPFDSELAGAVDPAIVPDVDILDETTWVPLDLGEHHAGALTAPGWLLRHQTNRGRANRFYGGFLCRDFIPPEGGIGGLETDVPTPDLTLREGCQDCHARLEPWAAYWGRWQEAGMAWRSPELYPAFDQGCADCAIYDEGRGCDDHCDDYYLVSITHGDEVPYAGWLSTYAFLEPDQLDHPDRGPLGWVGDALDDSGLASCAAQNAADWLLGDAGLATEEELSAWADAFAAGGNDYRSVYRAIVTSERYGRVK